MNGSYSTLTAADDDVFGCRYGKGSGIEPQEGHAIRHKLEHAMDHLKKEKGYKTDTT